VYDLFSSHRQLLGSDLVTVDIVITYC